MSEEIVRPGFNFIWAVENFSHALGKKGNFISSPGFKLTESGEIEWCVWLYPNGERSQRSLGMFLTPQNRSNGRIEISTEFELSLLSNDGEIVEPFQTNHTYTNGGRYGWFNSISRTKLLTKRRSELLPNDTLTIYCRILNINSKSVENASLYARSRIGVQKTSIIWSIENFSKFQPKQKASILLESVSTQIDFYFTFEVPDCGRVMQADISQVDISTPNLSICKISLLDVKGKAMDYTKEEQFFDGNKTECWNFPLFISRNFLFSDRNRYLPRDTLTLRCEISVSIGLIEIKIENYGHFWSQTVKSDDTSILDNLHLSKRMGKCHTLTEDLRQLYKDGTHSDMAVVVEEISFPVHKNILSARSSVFRAMFDRDMMEKRTGVVNIPDLDQDTVRRLLTFLYTDTVEDLQCIQCKDCIDLYIAADKYDIQYLKDKCSFLLRSSVNESNLVELLMLADKHSDQSLKKHLQRFMQGREKEIFSTREWDTLMTDNLRLAAEIMREFCLQK